MEEDNKKRRRAARRDFQDNVRELVAFVRKRDRRVIAWQQQQELEKQQRLAAEEQRCALAVSMLIPVMHIHCNHDRLWQHLPCENVKLVRATSLMCLLFLAC